MSERIFDCKGTLLAVGQRVIENGEEVGTIIELTESDGDWNDALGRAEQYGPYVHVRFDPCDDFPDGVDDRLICSWNGRWWDDAPDYTCDDVEVASEFPIVICDADGVVDRVASAAEAEAYIAEMPDVRLTWHDERKAEA